MPKRERQPEEAASADAEVTATIAGNDQSKETAQPEAKKQKRGGPEHREFGRPFDFECSQCKRMVPKSEYSKKQFISGAKHRKCNQCKGTAYRTAKPSEPKPAKVKKEKKEKKEKKRKADSDSE